MKKYLTLAAVASLALATSQFALAQNYTQVNLVANKPGVAAETDSNLVNPWGISRSSSSPWWVVNAGTGTSTLYNGAGIASPLIVTIPKNPANTNAKTGSPAGIVFNADKTAFLVGTNEPADFLFATLDGTIAGWNPSAGLTKGQKAPSTHAITRVATKDGSVFTGMASALLNGQTNLYLANFTKGRVDVYSPTFQHLTLPPVSNGDRFNPGLETPFVDALLPAGYAPYNVQAIGQDLVVTYAPDSFTGGPGNGYVDIYSTAGELLKRLEWGPWFNAPWGVALAPNDFGTFSHALLIGQFGFDGTTTNSGTIAAFDLITGNYIGQIEDSTGKPIAINGLWSIAFGNAVPNSTGTASGSFDPTAVPSTELYFTAGPNGEQDGLLGYLAPVPTELTQGNNQ
jgi:uncharacterized protein (TIGR03118 family)